VIRYWDLLQPKNVDLEREIENLDLPRLKRMSARSWYDLLTKDYFR
jgi:hypothetical protein